MRIARPRKPAAAFKRKRSPPPQATKLLRYSMISGIVFMVLLGLVFLPRMFPAQIPVAIIELRLQPNVTRIDVVSVTETFQPGRFRADYSQDGVVIASLDAGLSNRTVGIVFVDANTNGYLDPGDHFDIHIACSASSTYRFEIFQVDVDRRVGFLSWSGCPQANV